MHREANLRQLFILTFISGIALLAGILFQQPASTTLLMTATAVGSFPIAQELWEELHQKKIGLETLKSLAIIGSALMGRWTEAATISFLFALAEALEKYTLERTSHSVKNLASILPHHAIVKRQTGEEVIPVDELEPGNLIVVKAGERVPVDGIIVRGRSFVSEAPITGEAAPRTRGQGDRVFAGSYNLDGYLEIEVTKPFKEATLAKIAELVEQARGHKAPAQAIVERFGVIYTPVVLASALGLAIIPPLLGQPWQPWTYKSITFLVAASPCAFLISIPVAYAAAIGNAARRGILLKGGFYLEEMARIKVLAMDKTGTLTQGKPYVTDIVTLDGQYSTRELLRMAASLEAKTNHPLAKAVMERALKEGIELSPVEAVEVISGTGIRGTWQGKKCSLGSRAMYRLSKETEQLVSGFEKQGKTIIIAGESGRPVGIIALQDQLRPEAPEALQTLAKSGINITLLSGDNPNVVRQVAKTTGINEYQGGLLPQDKVTILQRLRNIFEKVAMVGDGINDAPALAEASVGIAMGQGGTDITLGAADVVLLKDDLTKLGFLLHLGRSTRAIVMQNLIFALATIPLMVLVTFAGWFTLTAVVIGHELADLAVVLNALRLLTISPDATHSLTSAGLPRPAGGQ